MRRMAIFAALTAWATLAAVRAPAPPDAPDAGTDRPRDPWVFRCVLDQQPRMVVIALHEHLWVAYDATDCTLYKAWDGDVKFTGAVYDYVHGPQPEVRGQTLIEGESGADWAVATADGQLIDATAPTWRGYRFESDSVVLQFEITLPGGQVVAITESPEVSVDERGRIALSRTFAVGDLPDQRTIVLRLPTTAMLSGRAHYVLDGEELTPARMPETARPFVALRSGAARTLITHFASEEGGRR